MIRKITPIALVVAGALSLFSCKDMPTKTHGAIVLGDSSTIVTENDPQKLQDLVTDLQPVIPPSENKDAEETKPQDKTITDTGNKKVAATAPAPPARSPLSSIKGLLADFKDVSILIPNVNAKLAGRTNLRNANGAVYTLISGNLNGNEIKVNGNVTKVFQRYQSVVVLKNGFGTLPLESLATTTDWKQMRGGREGYRISGLDPQSLDYPDASVRAIRNAVVKAARRRRMSRRKIEEMENSIRRVRSLRQKPLSVRLRSVMWKIEGKDEHGRLFSRQIRIDIPM